MNVLFFPPVEQLDYLQLVFIQFFGFNDDTLFFWFLFLLLLNLSNLRYLKLHLLLLYRFNLLWLLLLFLHSLFDFNDFVLEELNTLLKSVGCLVLGPKLFSSFRTQFLNCFLVLFAVLNVLLGTHSIALHVFKKTAFVVLDGLNQFFEETQIRVTLFQLLALLIQEFNFVFHYTYRAHVTFIVVIAFKFINIIISLLSWLNALCGLSHRWLLLGGWLTFVFFVQTV